MFRELRQNLTLLLLTILITGIAYPYALTGLGQALFPDQANGSLIDKNNVIIGSSLIGQNFKSDKYFHGRPSAAGAGYDALNSSGSNLAPSSIGLSSSIKDRVSNWEQAGHIGAVPIDLVTTSASGLDPDISVAAARYQAAKVAAARSLPLPRIEQLIKDQTTPPTLGFIGEPRVNVLHLNLALEELAPLSTGAP